jgi:hypothetical protein
VGKPARAHDRLGRIVIPLIAVLLVSGKLYSIQVVFSAQKLWVLNL